MAINNLPASFPDTVFVTLQKGTHQGAKQLWARYAHQGVDYRLVISTTTFDAAGDSPPCEGETWAVDPYKSPNGHVVFCTPVERVAPVYCLQPIVAAAQKALREGGKLRTCRLRDGLYHQQPDHTDTLKSVSVTGNELELELTCGHRLTVSTNETNIRFSSDELTCKYWRDGEEYMLCFFSK